MNKKILSVLASVAFLVLSLPLLGQTVGIVLPREKTCSWSKTFASRTTVSIELMNHDDSEFDNSKSYVLAILDGDTTLAHTEGDNSTSLSLSGDNKTLSGAIYLNTTELITDRMDSLTTTYAGYRLYLVSQDKELALVLDDVRIYKTGYYYGAADPTGLTDTSFNTLSAIDAVADGDTMAVYDTSASTYKKSTFTKVWTWIKGNLGITTKGDLMVTDGSSVTRLGVGTDDQVLTADSSETSGLKWADAAGGGIDTSGTPVDNDFAKFTDADTVEGRSYAEVADDIEASIDHGNLTGLSTGADHSYLDQDVTSGSSPTLDGTNITGIPNGGLDETYVNADGSVALTADWDIGDGRRIDTDEIRARDGAGLKFYDDGGNGIFVEDGGQVGIGTATPSALLNVYKDSPSMNEAIFRVGTSDNANRFLIDEDGDVFINHNGISRYGVGVNGGTSGKSWVRSKASFSELAIGSDGTSGLGIVKSGVNDDMALQTHDGNTDVMRLTTGGNVKVINDNAKLTLGAGDDCEQYYDGTDWIVDTDAVGTGSAKINGLEIDKDGYLKPVTSAEADAPNNSIFYNSDDSVLSYKDSGGTVNNLY